MGSSQQALFMSGAAAGATDPYFSSVVFLGHFDGADGSQTFTNSCPRGNATLTANGTAQLGTTVVATPQFGSASLRCMGVGSAFASGNHADYSFGTADFTIEMWLYTTSSQDVYMAQFFGAATPYFRIDPVNSGLYIERNGALFLSAGAWSLNTWTSFAISRVSGTMYLFKQGVLMASGADSSNFAGTVFRLGVDLAGSFPWTGNIDELRITNGVGRYTATYTPAIAPFPDS